MEFVLLRVMALFAEAPGFLGEAGSEVIVFVQTQLLGLPIGATEQHLPYHQEIVSLNSHDPTAIYG